MARSGFTVCREIQKENCKQFLTCYKDGTPIVHYWTTIDLKQLSIIKK